MPPPRHIDAGRAARSDATNAPKALAKRAACASDFPSNIWVSSPAVKASPAPTVSTTSMGTPGTSISSSNVQMEQPHRRV